MDKAEKQSNKMLMYRSGCLINTSSLYQLFYLYCQVFHNKIKKRCDF